MRATIFANGEIEPESARGQLRPGDLIVAADGGARHALALGVTPNVVIGDFDSLSPDEQAHAEAAGARLVRFSPRKDETDLELALLHAARSGADEIVILGALGRRLDQTLANVLLLALPALRGIDVRIVEGAQEALLVRDEVLVHGCPGDTLSLIPLGGDALGVTVEGVEWPLRGETLRFGLTRGVSNILVGERARVGVQKGMLLCVVTRKVDRETRRHGDAEKGGF